MGLSKRFGISLLAAAVSATAPRYLAPLQDINFPSSESATDPLKWLGANGPWHAGKVFHALEWHILRIIN